MAIKKSELYSSLWASCDELRGGMDASQYKDYVLVMLFIKYISDKYAGVPYAPITVPEGASFSDMVKMKGQSDIGDRINKEVIAPLAEANQLQGTINVADWDSSEKLGNQKTKKDKLTNLIAIFENPALDFSKNKADGDDILGDAYEYLMRHFATQSGKSKGQFYTPGEVSRIMAKILGVSAQNTDKDTTVFDPACGSGSLLLRVAHEANDKVSLYGQEIDVTTSGLARMNMVLHNYATAIQTIKTGNTLADPEFTKDGQLKRFDYVVANPPFSQKNWSSGFNPGDDDYKRFDGFGEPPAKNGDYAFLLHILASLKKNGKGAVILPHGVLFRGNAEAAIRKNLIRRGFIKGIIGLPANLFYGTGIPACIIMLDKEGAEQRKGIFFIDASKGYMKDGAKNRLRERDIHRVVDVFNAQEEVPKYSRMVALSEIEQNDFNLNIPRYIDSQEAEDIQDIEGHLKGGIPQRDVDALSAYWEVFPAVRKSLVEEERPAYLRLRVEQSEVKQRILDNAEFKAFSAEVQSIFDAWAQSTTADMEQLEAGLIPKEKIAQWSEALLQAYRDARLMDAYDLYQHLMDYWAEAMQDDLYIIAADGWEAGGKVERKVKVTKKKGGDDKVSDIKGLEGIESKLIPSSLMVEVYFQTEQKAINEAKAVLEQLSARKSELEEEHGGEEGVFGDMEKVNNAEVKKLFAEYKGQPDYTEERKVLGEYLELSKKETAQKKVIKGLEEDLEKKVWAHYATLTVEDIKQVVIQHKWMKQLRSDAQGETERLGQQLAQRMRELAERYAQPLPEIDKALAEVETQVQGHLQQMGYVWN